MKIISIFLALINSLLAGLLITFLVTSVDFRTSMAWWSMARILLALSIIGVGILSWIEMVVPVRAGLIMLSSLFLVALGPCTVMWAFHRATQTGHMQYYMLMYGASLFVQGVSLLFGMVRGRDSVSA